MNSSYREAFGKLNAEQRQAVETIEGPVLVVAGPGTGKTQLLAVRAAHILQKTDTLPQQILCLTFTENGAQNMRERLTQFIGQDAYGIHISTYHAFGSEIIRRFPEAFTELRLQSPVDELTKHRILREIIESLSYDNPLKQLRHHLGDLIGTISEVKRALLNAEQLRIIAAENQTFIARASEDARRVFDGVGKMPGTHAKAAPLFERLLEAIRWHVPEAPAHARFGSLAAAAVDQLTQALLEAENTGKSTPLTAWKNNWLAKDTDNNFIFDGALENNRITALADVCERYDKTLADNGWYDFDDMIMLAARALEEHPDLKYTLQEQYLYLMLDEFQDTNAAQLKLVQLLTDNPAHEGRPNVLAVGDDDQAIYAFQGAEYSNMLDFYKMYRDVAVINLTGNYRSNAGILATAQNIAGQIGSRLTQHFTAISKTLVPKNVNLPPAAIERRDFASDVAQYDWIAAEIERLVKKGTKPSEIAVLAPKHKYLEPLVPHLAKRGIPMRYEKRENVLEAPVVRQLLTMARLVLALRGGDKTADALWPEVLSYDFWQIPVRTVWELSWRVRDEQTSWSRVLLDSLDPDLQTPALLLLSMAAKIESETCERMIDYLLGNEPLDIREGGHTVCSPLRDFYLGKKAQAANPGLLYDTVSHLTVLRAKLREYQGTQDSTLKLPDLISFVDMYEEAEQRMLNTSPYNQQADAVQLMTVYKAKGLEFEHVFLPSAHDDVWGGSAKNNGNKLTLPPNLAPIRYAGSTDDERLRILFVAVTRAKYGLHLTGYTHNYAGKTTKRLQYLDEQEQEDGGFKCMMLPPHAQQVILDDGTTEPTLEVLELNWQQRHAAGRADASLRQLLQQRLEHYQLSPTHLTRFVDLVYGGPESVFLGIILGFPSAPSVNSQFGDAIHATLEWMQLKTNEQGKAPSIDAAIKYFTVQLQTFQFTDEQRALEQQRGERALRAYLTKNAGMFRPGDKAEHRFTGEGVFVGRAHLSGKIDRLEIDHTNKTVVVADYKTGKTHIKWMADASLHKYKLQLYLYRMLVEGSRTFQGYKVTGAYLDFVEPDQQGQVHRLNLVFVEKEYQRVRKLVEAVWDCLTTLNLPDISQYTPDLKGIEAFEADLLLNSAKDSSVAKNMLFYNHSVGGQNQQRV